MRGARLYVYLFIPVCDWTMSKEDTPTSLVYCWCTYLEPHDFRDAF
jgi:hypothetical protein